MRIIIRRTGVCLVLCAAIAVIAGCGSSGSGSSGSSGSGGSASNASASSAGNKPISILWIGDMTGPTKALATVQLAGGKAAAEYFNTHGGLDGHHVNITTVSDNGDGATAVSELVQHLSSGTPTMVIGGSEAGDVAATIPVIAKHKVFAIDLNDGNLQCMTNASVTCPNEFVEATPDTAVQYQAADWFKSKGFKKVGLLQEEIDFTEHESPAFISRLKQAGIQVKTVSFPETALDLSSEVQELKSDGVQAIYTEALGAAAGYALKARAALGMESTPMAFDLAAASLDITKLAPAADIKNAYEVTYFDTPASVKNQGIEELLKLGPKYGDVAGNPVALAGLGWDYLVNLNAALKTDGNSFDVDALDKAMLHLPPTDPLRVFTRKLGYTNNDHEDVLGGPDDFTVIPLGPIVNGQIGS